MNPEEFSKYDAEYTLTSKAQDDLEDELSDDDTAFGNYREKRFAELKAQQIAIKDMQFQGHGEIKDLTKEKDFLIETLQSEKVVIHFKHKDFRRCDIMDSHLRILARRHFKTKFLRVDVELVPFFVDKLQIKVLPCVVAFLKGKEVGRVVGFDQLGGSDEFPTEILEHRLDQIGVIDGPGGGAEARNKASSFGYIQGKKEDDSYETDSDEW